MSSTRIWVADVNGDGKLDLIVGDSLTLSSADMGSEEERQKKFAAWEKSLDEAVKRLNSSFESDEQREQAVQRFKELSNQRGEFASARGDERTGFVWLYLQK